MLDATCAELAKEIEELKNRKPAEKTDTSIVDYSGDIIELKETNSELEKKLKQLVGEMKRKFAGME